MDGHTFGSIYPFEGIVSFMLKIVNNRMIDFFMEGGRARLSTDSI